MANTGSIVRKNLRDLSNSMEMRELNRQLDWIWKKILGGLTAKDFSDGGMRSVVEVVEKTIASEIAADEVTTNILKTALAEMMVAKIGVAKIDYAQIVDIFSERIFTDEGLAGEFRMDKLKVYQAQIVDLIVSSFRLVSDDGKVYKVSVDKAGNLVTEYLEDQNAWLNNGEVPDGYSAVVSDLTVGEVTAGKLYVAGAADIMKLTAKVLIADTAWINELIAAQAFIDSITTSKIINGKSLEIIAGEVDTANTNADNAITLAVSASNKANTAQNAANAAQDSADEAKSAADGAQSTADDASGRADIAGTNANAALEKANNAVSKEDFQRLVRVDTEGLHVGDNQNDCEVLIDSDSMNVVKGGEKLSTFADSFARMSGVIFKITSKGLAIDIYDY